MRIFTIGFTKKTAEDFFGRLKRKGVKRVIDTRLNNVSQLAGFAKRDDLRFFLWELGGVDYVHMPELAPTQDILDDFKKHKGSWTNYERRFLQLMKDREIERTLDHDLAEGACLLCSEDKPHYCHRRLVAEYLKEKWGSVDIVHL